MQESIGTLHRIKIKNIALDDNTYKISRQQAAEDVRTSVRQLGILCKPVVQEHPGGMFRIVTGHNRIRIMQELGEEYLSAFVVSEVSCDWFIDNALLKNYHNELGPVGKAVLLSILDREFNIDYSQDNRTRNGLQLPGFLFQNRGLLDTFLSFPVGLLHFLDEKNISFKVIKTLLAFDADVIGLLDEWTQYVPFRVNVFKNIVTLLTDLVKIDKKLVSHDLVDRKLLAASVENPHSHLRDNEQLIYSTLYGLRYPGYTELDNKYHQLSDRLKEKGVTVQFPQYFEGNTYCITINMKKGETVEKLQSIVRSIQNEELNGLSELL